MKKNFIFLALLVFSGCLTQIPASNDFVRAPSEASIEFMPKSFSANCRITDLCFISFQIKNVGSKTLYFSAGERSPDVASSTNERVLVQSTSSAYDRVKPMEKSGTMTVNLHYVGDASFGGSISGSIKVPIQIRDEKMAYIATANQYYTGTFTFTK